MTFGKKLIKGKQGFQLFCLCNFTINEEVNMAISPNYFGGWTFLIEIHNILKEKFKCLKNYFIYIHPKRLI